MKYLPSTLLLALLLLAAACNQPGVVTPTAGGDELGTMVAATITAVSQSTPTLPAASPTEAPPMTTPTLAPTETTTVTPAAPSENVRGRVCFPGEAIPEMTAYFQELESDQVVEVPVEAGKSSYAVLLPPGEYQAYAWLPDFSRGGLYSKAVVCGLGENCTDHSPVTFEIEPGAMVEGVDLCDWYGGPFAVPYPPGKDRSQVTGTVSGAVSYPSGSPPAMKVVFFNLDTQEWGYFLFKAGSTRYRLTGLAPGRYQIVAYTENGRAGGHADAAHNLIPVTVKPGETLNGIDITAWDPPAGTFPPDPTQ